MQFGRRLKTAAEKEFWKEAYKIGMENGWCSGKYAEQDGNFIVEEDRLNKKSVLAIDNIATLKAFFKQGNWCLGQAVIYKSLCFIQQVNGGDEWLVIKCGQDSVFSFESWSCSRMDIGKEIKKVLKATDEQLKRLEY